jgi:capsular exopolysaccharide synthesis family protein
MTAPGLPSAAERPPAPPDDERPAGRMLLAYWRTLSRHKWGILGLVFAAGLLSLLIANSLEPVYEARTTLLVDTGRQSFSPVGDDTAIGGWMSYYNRQSYLQTQLLLIRSRALAVTVAERLALWTEPTLDPRREAPKRARLVLDLERWLPWGNDDASAPIPESAARDAVIAGVRGGVNAELVPDSDIIELTWQGSDPVLTARIANAYAESFIELGLETRLKQVQQAAGWLTERLGGLREQLEASEQALQRYRETHGLIALEGPTDLTDQALKDLADRLIEARAEHDRLQALLVQARGLQPLAGAGFAAHPTVAGNPVIQALKAEEVAAERQVQELAKRYGGQHPRMVAAREDLRTVRDKLRAEVANVIAALRKERDIAAARVQQFETALDGLKSTAQERNRQAFALTKLEREVETNRQLYDLFLTRFKETDLGTDLESTDARVIDAALAPRAPVKPRRWRIVLVTGLLSGLFGAGIAFLLEHLDNTIKTGTDVEDRLGLPLLGSLPLLSARRLRRTTPERLLVEQPKSEFAESVRTIRTGLVLAGVDQPQRRVLITSSVPGEGKTTLAMALAVSLAKLERVLLIDADLRRATIGRHFQAESAGRGLSELVAGEAGIDDCVTHDETTGLDLLPAGTLPPNPLELLSSRRFAGVLEELSGRYERLIVDSAPTQAVSDALMLAQQCDAVLYVIKADATPLPVVEIALRRLRQVSAPLTGAVLNQFDSLRSARYGHDHYGRYQRYAYTYGGYGDEEAEDKRRSSSVKA